MLSADNLRNALSDLIYTFGTNNFTGEKLARVAFACEKYADEIDQAGILLDEAFITQLRVENMPFSEAADVLNNMETRLNDLALSLDRLEALKQRLNNKQ